MRWVLALSLLFVSQLSLAGAPESFPTCYNGTLKSKAHDGTTESRSVFLSLGERVKDLGSELVRVRFFYLGTFEMRSSGGLVKGDTLQFNDNNDYIPGGSASFNRDIELKFNDDGSVTGTYVHYYYPDEDGLGGYGQKGAGLVAEQGQILLKKSLCGL